ncbi:basic helix-loop-helix protein [Podila humilis]|nr:basic helix-loop-helix protein [Podila humilis]
MSSDLQNVEVQEVLNNLTNSIRTASNTTTDEQRELAESFTAAIAQSAAAEPAPEPTSAPASVSPTNFDQQQQQQQQQQEHDVQAQAQDNLHRIAEEHQRLTNQEQISQSSAEAVAAAVGQNEQDTAQQVLQHISAAESTSTLATVAIAPTPIASEPAPPPPVAKPTPGSDEWHKLRRNNHKEVERRRRDFINTGIDRVAALLPNSQKNKGNILKEAVNYIKETKTENETMAAEVSASSALKTELESVKLMKAAAETALHALSLQHEELKLDFEQLRSEVEGRANKRHKSK